MTESHIKNPRHWYEQYCQSVVEDLLIHLLQGLLPQCPRIRISDYSDVQIDGTASYRVIHKQLDIGAPTVLPWEFISDTDVESRFMMLAAL
jgi:hypothetical protein